MKFSHDSEPDSHAVVYVVHKVIVTPFPQMPCKLEEDYTEYDDPDDFFPDIPTLVPWYSINCGNAWTQLRLGQADDDDDKILDEKGGDHPDKILGMGDSKCKRSSLSADCSGLCNWQFSFMRSYS